MLTPQQIADKWFQRASAAGPAIIASVNAMTEAENPMQKAAAAADRWAQGCQRAAQEGSFQKGLSKVSMAQWRAAMTGKGVANYQNGLAAGKTKMVAFQQVFQPFLAQAVAQLPPRGTLAENKARASAMIDALSRFSLAGTGGTNYFGG